MHHYGIIIVSGNTYSTTYSWIAAARSLTYHVPSRTCLPEHTTSIAAAHTAAAMENVQCTSGRPRFCCTLVAGPFPFLSTSSNTPGDKNGCPSASANWSGCSQSGGQSCVCHIALHNCGSAKEGCRGVPPPRTRKWTTAGVSISQEEMAIETRAHKVLGRQERARGTTRAEAAQASHSHRFRLQTRHYVDG